jgi:hypothetical protein
LNKESDEKLESYLSDKLELSHILDSNLKKRSHNDVDDNCGVVEGEDYNPNDCNPLGEEEEDDHDTEENHEDQENNKRLKMN